MNILSPKKNKIYKKDHNKNIKIRRRKEEEWNSWKGLLIEEFLLPMEQQDLYWLWMDGLKSEERKCENGGLWIWKERTLTWN